MLPLYHQKILEDLQSINSKAESLGNTAELLRSTLIVPNHLNFAEPDILLVLGVKGAGKSHLFRFLNSEEGQRLTYQKFRTRVPEAIWIKGFDQTGGENPKFLFPNTPAFQKFAEEYDTEASTLDHFWRGLLFGSLHKQTDLLNSLDLPSELLIAFSDLTAVSNWYPQAIKHYEKIESALNYIDEILLEKKKYLFVSYDDLDIITLDWQETRVLIQSLLRFWLIQWRRWRRIRPKIFLRTDLFDHQLLHFPDASKLLLGNKLTLNWGYRQLYSLVFKIWANKSDDSRHFLEEAGLEFTNDSDLHWNFNSWELPTEEQLKSVVHKIIGHFMGSGTNKGDTFKWIPNHLQDAKGEIVPRSMLNLFSFAAKSELENQRTKEPFLLSPLTLGEVIKEVSIQRVQELSEEFHWINDLTTIFADHWLPMSEAQLNDLLTHWKESKPFPSNLDTIETLEKIGVLRKTKDNRFHVPDIYLHGFNMKRKGGIKQPK